MDQIPGSRLMRLHQGVQIINLSDRSIQPCISKLKSFQSKFFILRASIFYFSIKYQLNRQIEIAQKLMIKDLDIEDPGLVFSNISKLEHWLTGEIRILIDRDFQGLMNILYRIDVSEEKTKRAFTTIDPANELSKLIIERELQKVATREKYK